MLTRITRAGLTLVAAIALSLTGCSNGTDSAEEPNTEVTRSSTAEETTEASGNDGDYAFGADRDQMAEAVEGAFKSAGGKARWDGDTLILALAEGDANAETAGFTQCRVLSHLLKEDDESAIEFPNGRVSCAEVLAEE